MRLQNGDQAFQQHNKYSFTFCHFVKRRNFSKLTSESFPSYWSLAAIFSLTVDSRQSMLLILGLNFARLDLLVAETFGEEENSILETARWSFPFFGEKVVVLSLLRERCTKKKTKKSINDGFCFTHTYIHKKPSFFCFFFLATAENCLSKLM